jgi:hypothetical protein
MFMGWSLSIPKQQDFWRHAMQCLSKSQRMFLLALIAGNPVAGEMLSPEEEDAVINEPWENWPKRVLELFEPWKPDIAE